MTLLFEIDNEEQRIDVPLHPSEIPFSDFCDFRGAENAYWDINKEADPDDPEPVNALLRALKCVVSGDLDKLPFSIPGDDFQDLVDTGFQVQVGVELSILRVYAHFVVMVQDYKPESIPETFRLKWHGKKYIVKSGEAARVLTNRPLTTGETIEALEYQRRAGKAAELKPGEMGNIEFTLGLTEFAILVRKIGEKLPIERKDLDRFINQRQRLFKNLPLDKVIDLRFFLLNALVRLKVIRTTGFSGTDLRARDGGGTRTRKRGSRKWLGTPGT